MNPLLKKLDETLAALGGNAELLARACPPGDLRSAFRAAAGYVLSARAAIADAQATAPQTMKVAVLDEFEPCKATADDIEHLCMQIALLAERDRAQADKPADALAFERACSYLLGAARDLQARGYGRAPSGLRNFTQARRGVA